MGELGKRQMERFNLSIPAIVSLRNKEETASKSSLEMKTRNVCAGGAFIETDGPLQVGTEVDLDLHLSIFNGSKEYERRSNIHVSGWVIRSEPAGMAIRFDDNYRIFPA